MLEIIPYVSIFLSIIFYISSFLARSNKIKIFRFLISTFFTIIAILSYKNITESFYVGFIISYFILTMLIFITDNDDSKSMMKK